MGGRIKERCSDVEWQNLFTEIKGKRSLIFYSEMNCAGARKEYTVCCTENKKSGLAWFEIDIWKLTGMRKGSEKERYPLCIEDEDAVRILLKCLEMRRWREQFFNGKCLCLMK